MCVFFFFFFSVCAVDLCLLSCTGWIIHLQADEKRAGKVRSAEVEWPWFLLAAGHPAVAVVIIHTSQMAFPWASMKRTGQGLSCQVLPGSEATLGQCGTWGVRECFWMRSRGETRWKCSLITVTVCLVITHNVTFNCPLRSRRKGYRQSRLKRPIRFSFSKLGLCAFTTSHCNPSVELFFFFF